MRLWFVLGSPMARRFVDPVIAELTDAGHDVHIGFVAGRAEPFASLSADRVRSLARDDSKAAAVNGPEVLRTFASYVRLRRDWEPLMRARWLEYFPPTLNRFIRAVDALGLSLILDNHLTQRALVRLATALPTPRALRDELKRVAPDVLVLTPMIYPGTRELDLVADASRRGVPSVGLVLSWDNLTSKASFLRRPDLLLVWNEAQRRDAVDRHGFPARQVEALGAPVFDYLFARDDVTSRSEWLSSVGVDQDGSYVLYAVSSRLGLGAGGEVELVRRLGAELRKSARDVALLVRPHPRNATSFDQDLGQGVTVLPAPDFPSTEEHRRQLRALLVNADAVVGLNTSLFIEAAIVGTPAIAMTLDREIERDRMSSSLTHFDHLRQAGFLHCAEDPAEVVSTLRSIREVGDAREPERRVFVESFVRPRGLECSAAKLVAERLVSFG